MRFYRRNTDPYNNRTQVEAAMAAKTAIYANMVRHGVKLGPVGNKPFEVVKYGEKKQQASQDEQE